MARRETRHSRGGKEKKSPNPRRRSNFNNNKSWTKSRLPRKSNGRNTRGNNVAGRGSATNTGSGGGATARNKSQRLRPIRPPSENSIHKGWKQELGGLIRWYANRNDDVFPAEEGRRGGGGTKAAVLAAEEDVEKMYTESGCTIDGTRNAILRALSGSANREENSDGGNFTAGSEWIDLSMVVEAHESGDGAPVDTDRDRDRDLGGKANRAAQGNDRDASASNKGGTKLAVERRPGEGPAFAHETWTNVIVPPWAVGESYHFEVSNRSPVDLSCEMTIDGHGVAKNAPIPANSTRAVRPDNTRYFESHKWVFQPSRRVKLQQHPVLPPLPVAQRQEQSGRETCARQAGQRYNGVRPDYKDQRVDPVAYPDATRFGWTFTGSSEASLVEFFEKTLNMGLVRMDFYYTTGTVRTVLDHPTLGTNQLFRSPPDAGTAAAAAAVYGQILTNPRHHTGIGYRKRGSTPPRDRVGWGGDALAASQSSPMAVDGPEEAAAANADASDGDAAEDGGDDETMQDGSSPPPPVFFAKNPEYDFRNGGHVNRKAAMAELQPTGEFRAWEEAARKEWACVHARFFVSLANRRGGRRRPPRRGVRGGKSDGEALPEMAPVVDVKAAEKAVLSTKFHATGPARPRRTSDVRMERISLNDDPKWGSGPVFECKLYYRADNAITLPDDQSLCSELIEAEDDVSDGMEDADAVPLAEQLRHEAPINEYKTEKLGQLNRWHDEYAVFDKEEAEARLSSCRRAIEEAESTLSVDEAMKVYWDWNQKQPWLATAAGTKQH